MSVFFCLQVHRDLPVEAHGLLFCDRGTAPGTGDVAGSDVTDRSQELLRAVPNEAGFVHIPKTNVCMRRLINL